MMNRILLVAGLLTANYYATTFAIWLGHWSSHSRYSPLRDFHMGGHHALYPDSNTCLSRTFLYGTGRHDSLFALLPLLIAQVAALGLVTPAWLRGVLWLETVAVAAAVIWLHSQFHKDRATLDRFAWFNGARRVHFAHHDRDVNFMIGDPFWDRLLGTHEWPNPAGRAEPASGPQAGESCPLDGRAP